MKKIKTINSISNRKKTLRLAVHSNEKVVKSIETVLNKLKLCGYFEYYDNILDKHISTYKPAQLKDKTISFFQDEETGFIIFKESSIDIILLKSSKYYKPMEKELFSIFDFVDSSINKKNKRNI